METIVFPEIAGKNLQRKKKVFPQDFPAKYTVVLIAFLRHQQLDIDTWLPFVEQIENKYQDVAYVELPVLSKMGPVGQIMLNEGMRAGIPSRKSRERTITLYLNKAEFLGQLGIHSEKDIQILLVNEDGKVVWHEIGLFSVEKGNALENLILQKNK